MSAPEDFYVKLRLSSTKGGRSCHLIAPRATAKFYGWTKAFEEWAPPTYVGADGRTYAYDPGRKGAIHFKAGKQIRISRSEKRAAYPPGMTNAFRVSRTCTNFHLAELAHFTDVEWHWMYSMCGRRLSRGTWEEMYQTGFLAA